MDADTKGPSVPYISFKTITNLAEKLEPEPPPRIDRSVLSYLSGGYRSQVMSSLKILGLTEQSGVPTDDLVRLVTVPAERKQIIKVIWERTYAQVFSSVDVTRATADQLAEAFTQHYNVTGDTRAKAMIFFVHGCNFAEIALSTRITGGIRRTRGTGTKRGRATGKPEMTESEVDEVEQGRKQDRTDLVSVGVHPMLMGAIKWLEEKGEGWTKEQAEAWLQSWRMNVLLVYPPTDQHGGRGEEQETEDRWGLDKSGA
jgi:hypothetical protein